MVQCAAFAVTGCVLAGPRHRPDDASAAARSSGAPVPELCVVLVTLDGTRWHEVFEGVDPKLAESHGLSATDVVDAAELMPNLHRIVATHGAALGAPGHGEPISASGPNFVSLPGYAELLSGRRVTDCKDNQCSSSGRRTLFDDFSIASGRGGSPAVAFTSWPDISRVESERGPFAEPAPRPNCFRPDALTADLAIEHLAAHAPRFIFVGLGEPDEYGHQNDYAGYLRALRYADRRIGEIDGVLQGWAAQGTRTALFVTADHGRGDGFTDHGARFPESARVWLVAAGSALHGSGFVAAPVARRLADLAPTVRAIAGLPRDSDAAAGTALNELL